MKNIFNLFKKKYRYADPVFSPEERVKSYIFQWHEQWSKIGEDVDFNYWGELISVVDEAHFTVGSSSGSKNSFCGEAEFDPSVSKITGCDIQGGFAQISTEIYNKDLQSSKYHVYELTLDTEKGWKIKNIYTLCYPPKNPVIDIIKHADILAMSSINAPLMDKGEHNLNENVLFQSDRYIKTPHFDEGLAKLNRIGKLSISSGVLGILDFGYDIYNFEPLQRKVIPGDYPIETVTVNDRVAGIRVKFSDHEQPVKWYAANTPSGCGVYGVDAGNLALFDVSHLLTLKNIEKEKIFNEYSRSGKAQLVSMKTKNDCFITPSGFGDGAYPAFWGVNGQDEVISLYIDFLILVQETKDSLFESI
ncbi:MAG: DUF4241 domain-containing protein [Burkholderiales bacterium]|nr:DUF4241 domain-containing protein [Burkholderiales bacterium]